ERVEQATTQVDFVPAATRMNVRIFLSDFGQQLLLPPLAAALRREAPGVTLETIDAPPREAAGMMDEGEVDIAVSPPEPCGAGFHRQVAFVDRYVCLARRDHPLVRAGVSARDYLQARHAVYVS